MWKHISTEHPNLAEPNFSMKILKAHKRPLNRQVHEAVMIMLSESTTLNSRGEFNRCQLPRLTVMMGGKEDKAHEMKDKPDDFFEDKLDVNSNLNQSKRKEHPTTTTKGRKRMKYAPEKGDKITSEAQAPYATPKRRREENYPYSCSKKPRNDVCEIPAKSETESAISKAHHRRMENLISKKCSEKSEKSKNKLSPQPSKSKNEISPHPSKAKTIIEFFENMKPLPSPSPSYKLSKTHPPTLSNKKNSKVNPKANKNKETPPKFPAKRWKQGKLPLITRFFEKVKFEPGDLSLPNQQNFG